MEQLPMQKRSTALVAVMVAIVLSLAVAVGYLVYVNHSTISSLKSELSEKDQIIDGKDNLIQQQNAIIDQNKAKIDESQKQVEDLQQKVSLKIEEQQAQKERESQFQDGWKATFYSLGIESTGKRPGQTGYGLTASGRAVQNDITIAVDPRQIPLGSWVEIQFPDGHVEQRRADDTGGAIKGHKIDVYIASASRNQLYDLGVQQIKVRLL